MKADVVAAGVSAIQAVEVQALSDQLGVAYDAGAIDQKSSDGSFTQADIDAAVAAAKAVDQAALDAAKVVSDAALADLQSKLDALAAKEGVESALIVSLQSAVSAVVALFPVS